MKKGLYFLLVLPTVVALSACSDEEGDALTRTMTLTETIDSDGGTVQKRDTYDYTDHRLMKHTTLQAYYSPQQSPSQSLSVSYERVFSYAPGEAVITDDKGNVATYTPGDNGYATRCIYKMGEQTREYDFTYSDDYLIRMDERIDGELFSSVKLEYNAGNLQTITANGQRILCQTGNDPNVCELPCILLADIHPLSLHLDAIFARLLGKQSTRLVTRTAPEGNDEEWTDYAYQLDASHQPTQITASTTSTGTVYDSAGRPSIVTRTDTRNIYLTIE